MSHLDRFLLSENLVRNWNIFGQWIKKRDISDHFPIWLKCNNNIEWDPKLFCFNNCWLKHDNFLLFAKTEWQKCVVNGIKDFILSEKLKSLKTSLRIWNKEVFGWIDLKVEGCVEYLNAMDNLLFDNIIGNIGLLTYERHKVVSEFWKHMDIKESFLRKNSRKTWLKEGDRNTSYFHNAMKVRNRHKFINSVETSNGVVEAVEDIKKAIQEHFGNFFMESNFSRSVRRFSFQLPQGTGQRYAGSSIF
ncbi:uncharacterized protein LOC131619230 [Vicia villosa]|uniref:uncharacterized protein LOC131619230 n=1 Tax=Vicia villosa TaxID=3911 RepID=UPI00273AA4A8|nr:uncharacterized protein LOC131619230 [Vicia villosa]